MILTLVELDNPTHMTTLARGDIGSVEDFYTHRVARLLLGHELQRAHQRIEARSERTRMCSNIMCNNN